MEDVKVPQYYLVGRSLTEEQILMAQRAFAFTPISHAIITDIHDAELALQFTPFIHKVAAERVQIVAAESREPVIVIGKAGFVEAVYSDGTSSPLTC